MLMIGAASLTHGETVTLTLEEARRIAFDRNWDLLAAKSGIDSATAQLIIAKEFPNPTASLSTAKIGSQEAGTMAGNSLWSRNYDTIAAVSQLVEVAGKRHDRQEAARAAIFGAKARFIDAKRSLDQGVTKAYLAALLAGENYRILDQSAGYLKKEIDIAQQRFALGDLSDSDKKQIEIAYEQFDLQAKAAKAAFAQARVAVEILLGIKQPKGNWKAGDTLERLVKAAPSSGKARPGAERPDVLAAKSDLNAAKANLKLQKAYRIPDPTFSVGSEHEPPGGGPSVNTWNFGVSFPLPLWNLNGGNIKAAEATVDQMVIALGKIKAQAFADVADAVIEYDEAHNRFVEYRDKTRPKSSFTREAVAYAYEHGGASLVDLLEAERTDNTVRQAVAQAMSDTASAVADLNAAQTALTETEINVRK
jgi:cobalt-zinc-cadmium efflux system outer membrane protein